MLKELGNGGFAVVYLVEKNGLRRALKVARHRDASGDEKQTHARVMRELTALLMLDHPNIIRHCGYGYAERGNVYLALEYVDGWTLGEWKERKHEITCGVEGGLAGLILNGLLDLRGLGTQMIQKAPKGRREEVLLVLYRLPEKRIAISASLFHPSYYGVEVAEAFLTDNLGTTLRPITFRAGGR